MGLETVYQAQNRVSRDNMMSFGFVLERRRHGLPLVTSSAKRNGWLESAIGTFYNLINLDVDMNFGYIVVTFH